MKTIIDILEIAKEGLQAGFHAAAHDSRRDYINNCLKEVQYFLTKEYEKSREPKQEKQIFLLSKAPLSQEVYDRLKASLVENWPAGKARPILLEELEVVAI